jgi:RNA-directed DNA polymerase
MALTLKSAFESTFRSNYRFEDFLALKVEWAATRKKLGDREIVQPNTELKSYLRFLNRFILSYANVVDEAVFSYKKDASPKQSLIKHCQSRCFYKTDIARFFESISSDDVQQVFANKLSKTPISDWSDYQAHLQRLVLVDGRLPIGFPSSPVISNSVLHEFDQAALAWAKQHKIIYTRYSDDLIFSAQNDAELKSLPQQIEKWLDEFYDGRFKPNPYKSFFTHTGKKVKLLGLVIQPNGHISVSRSLKNKIEALLHYFIEDRVVFARLLAQHFADNPVGVMSMLSWVQSVDRPYIEKLRKKYGNYTVDLFLHGAARL